MALSNLGELKASVADWLNREDLTTQIPDFISLGVNRIDSDIRSKVTTTEDVALVDLPSERHQNPIVEIDVESVTTLVVDGDVIPHVTYETYMKEKENPTVTNGVWAFIEDGVYYSGFAEPYDLTPASGGDTVGVEYRGHFKADFVYGDDTSSNLLFDRNPELFLYAALIEAAVYLRDMEGLQFYQVRYEELMDKVAKASKRRLVTGGFSVTSIGGDY